jgi:hypothetical protein
MEFERGGAMHTDPEIDQILAEQRRQRNRRRVRMAGIALAVVAAIVVIAFLSEPYLRGSRNAAREAAAIGSLRAIFSAQITFSTTCDGFSATRLTQLGSNGLTFLSPDLALADRVEKMGYQFWIDAEPMADAPACNGLPAGQLARSYVIRAEPLPGEGERFFAMSSEDTDVYEARESVRFVNGEVAGGATPVQ